MTEKKTKILVHVCCAPDATIAAERLGDFDLGVYFYNPNIQPVEEYRKRQEEMERLASKLGIRLHLATYEPDEWTGLIAGHESEQEGGARCEICFRIRLEKTAGAALELGYDMFATVLTTSPHKDADLINSLGKQVGEDAGILYYHSNFKKKNGFRRTLDLSRRYNLYRQDYCGCVFSKRERERTKKAGS